MKFDELYNINDTYKIKQDIVQLRALIDDIEKDLNAFLSHKKTKYKSVDARRKLRELRNEFIPSLQKKILKTRQDYDSDYS